MNLQKTILVAEDEKFLANIYRVKFEKSGFKVLIAEDGEKTLEILAKERPDIILLDLVMPVKDGFEVLKEIKSNALLKDIPVIVASNLGQDEDIKRAKLLGATDYFIKANMHLPELVSIVAKMLTA
ncbi:MAG TPA: response regulator [Patescibacteria group bacterium]|uniref:Response regulatory domain-containing protein n=1 Tax=Candidatus Woesebacteria bacterium RBG_13_46_13 TaxID=1802479 RepID=A0A1F7X4L6_9BACT|nr:MAG: hypothetical protein A2Y68_03475 [Candidatus Woesebacteria bacterium RBG_13_46_13]HJX59608.1 response regulator [Patescibacteria group bacterium]